MTKETETETAQDTLLRAARVIRQHQHPHLIEDWNVVSTDVDIKHIRYPRDSQGYFRFRRRLARALSPWALSGTLRDIFPGYRWWAPSSVWSNFVSELRKPDNLPDAALAGGSVITFWSEHAYHIALWSVEAAELVAAALEVEAARPEPSEAMVGLADHIIGNQAVSKGDDISE